MDWIEALVLGLVQGLTEFLPVSSSGHLIIGKSLLGIQVHPDAETTFEVLVHCATVLSTIVVFRNEIGKLLAGLFKFRMNEETQYVLKICISMLPVLIVGLFFKEQVEELFGQGVVLVGCMLIVTAILLTLTHFVKFKQRKELSYLSAFIIGVSQAIAVLPGLSRSGTTISTGLLIGNKKEDVARFSFLMVLVPILGETLLNVVGGEFSPAVSGIPLSAMTTGFLAAFISGLFACKVMIQLVKNSKLIYFAIYCVAMGLFALIYSFVS
ncbi:MAG: undecaprenyl-diphosphate phosphatase [Tannerella sp.]|jgi:undecaprenyl-diphosphatase|nr:undecaprenyl-diphosphate phosphatase [Tannerella sp.]